MERVRIYPLHGLDKTTRQRLKAAQMEAARVWMDCVALHRKARQEHRPWPDRDELQKATKGGQYALHSQSIQMVTHQFFLANIETIQQMKYRIKAISRFGETLMLFVPWGSAYSPHFLRAGSKSDELPCMIEYKIIKGKLQI